MMHLSRRKLQILIAVLAVIVIALSGVADVMAKYTSKQSITGQVTLTADIGQVGVWETTVTYDAAEGYVKGAMEGQGGKSYSYPIIPGLDIPKDTIVKVVKDAGSVPAYVYLIVDTNITSSENGIQYTLEGCWLPLGDEYPGVYVYCDPDTKEPVAVSSSIDIDVLVNDYIYVSQNVNKNVISQVYLNLYARLGQAYKDANGNDVDAVTVYNATFPTT